jgi:hypothetical protein
MTRGGVAWTGVIIGVYEIQGGCVIGFRLAEKRLGREWSHPLEPTPSPRRKGPWNGLYPAGFKLVRRAPHARTQRAIGSKLNQTLERLSRKLLRSIR